MLNYERNGCHLRTKNIPRGATVYKYGDHEPRVVHVPWLAYFFS